ncbi:hypothetical protein [Lyticum sinuosum]|uniref:Uncharacterized protein n=1 Tax=Lyticum sinuosum TaxID=1332059 RepID=A0AAE4VLF5_9RICK|nr:hypothetical protein [Lyticum sinuosum]MDZ5761407.1 hypothetical protein [Lyticum sinuosum]
MQKSRFLSITLSIILHLIIFILSFWGISRFYNEKSITIGNKGSKGNNLSIAKITTISKKKLLKDNNDNINFNTKEKEDKKILETVIKNKNQDIVEKNIDIDKNIDNNSIKEIPKKNDLINKENNSSHKENQINKNNLLNNKNISKNNNKNIKKENIINNKTKNDNKIKENSIFSKKLDDKKLSNNKKLEKTKDNHVKKHNKSESIFNKTKNVTNKKDISELLKNIDDNREIDDSSINNDNKSQSSGNDGEYQNEQLIREISIIADKINNSWNIAHFNGARDEKMSARIIIKLDRNANILNVRVLADDSNINPKYNEAFIQSAISAVYKAAPFINLPQDKYDLWNEIEIVFCPNC